MTDKQIIIGDVDVSWCKYWKGYCRIASLCDYPGHLCEVTPNCYYKQLKRKEQECEELNEYSVSFARKCQKLELDVCYLKDKNYNLQRRLDQLKAEKEEIKKYLGISSKTIMERLEELQEFRDNDKYKLYQAEQTLAEIKEIANRNYSEVITENWQSLLAKQILQKISECEAEK